MNDDQIKNYSLLAERKERLEKALQKSQARQLELTNHITELQIEIINAEEKMNAQKSAIVNDLKLEAQKI